MMDWFHVAGIGAFVVASIVENGKATAAGRRWWSRRVEYRTCPRCKQTTWDRKQQRCNVPSCGQGE